MNYSVYNEDTFSSLSMKEKSESTHAQFVKRLTNESIIPIERYNHVKHLNSTPMTLFKNMSDKSRSNIPESDLKRRYIETEIFQSQLISPSVVYSSYNL